MPGFPGFAAGEQTLIQEPHEEPVGGEVKADDASYVPAAASVVPWADFFPGEKSAREIFRGENQAHVSEPSGQGGLSSKQAAYGGEDGGAAVDGEHPQGGLPHKLQFAFSEGVKRSKQYFQTPSG